jgi:hypothetical protein
VTVVTLTLLLIGLGVFLRGYFSGYVEAKKKNLPFSLTAYSKMLLARFTSRVCKILEVDVRAPGNEKL